MEAQRMVIGDYGANDEPEIDAAKDNDPVNKMRIGAVKSREKGIPHHCDCGVAVTLEGGEGCGFRMWWDDAVLEEFEKIKDEKQVLQGRLDEAIKRIDRQEGRIYEMQMQYEEVMADRKQLDDYDGELCGTQLGLAEMRDKHSALERRFELLERKYQNLNKSI